MNRKTLQKLTNRPNYNQQLFTSAVAIVQNCQQLNHKTDSLTSNQKSMLRDKQTQLQTALKNAISSLGKLTNVQRTPLGTALDHSVQIYEAMTDMIETSVQKYRQANKGNKGNKGETTQSIKVAQVQKRPQDIYNFIKPANFDLHNHQKNLEFIRTDIKVMKSRSLQQKYEYVSTLRQLQQMVDELSREAEVAVDVQHSNKSYEGFTCLLQFSSRQKDYIVDVFPLWRDIPLLKKIMENETIVKVMHGAEMDTKWFQRDFNIHICNLFDTYRASRVMGFQKHSYAALLNHYCSQSTDKTYQLADWRIRPLTAQMIHYARIDTHFLLEIFDLLRADLHQKALSMNLDAQQVIREVYSSSYGVTKNEVELFNFRKKQFFLNLQKGVTQKDFVIFDKIFEILNDAARDHDIAFEQLVNHKLEKLVISKLREIRYHKGNDNAKTKAEQLILNLKEYELLESCRPKIATELEEFLKNAQKESQSVSKKKQKKNNKLAHIQQFENYDSFKKQGKTKSQYRVNFSQYSKKTYECLNGNPFTMLHFEPISNFVAKRAGIEEQQKDESSIQDEQEDKMVNEESEQRLNKEDEAQQAEAGVIEFKRINPNVIYTVEEAEAIQQEHKPRKKRRETQYEKKIKDKTGNIFQLLQD